MQSVIKRIKSNQMTMNYIWVFLGQNIGSCFSMLTLIFTLRVISTFDYGSLVIIQTYCGLISNIFCLRTFNGVIKYSTEAESFGNTNLVKKYLNTGFVLDLLTGIIAFVFGFILLRPVTILMGWDPQTVRFINFYMPTMLFNPVLNGTAVGILRQQGYFKHVNIIHAIVYGLQTFILLATWITKVGSLQVVALEYAFTEIIESVVLMIFAVYILQRTEKYRNFWKSGMTLESKFLKYNLSFGLLLTFDQILGNVSTLLINKYVGNFATAYLKVITRICSIITKITNPIGQIFYPELCKWITERKYKKALKVSIRYLYAILALGGVLTFVLFSTYSWWIVIFDATMVTAKYQSMLYFIYTMLSVAIICIQQMSLALDMMKANLVIVAIADLSYLGLIVPCILKFGVYGYLMLQILQLIVVFFSKYIYINHEISTLEKNNDA